MKKYMILLKISNQYFSIFTLFLFFTFSSCTKPTIKYKIPSYKLNQQGLSLMIVLKETLLENGGVSTQFKGNTGTDKIILSESQGLLMEIAVLTGDKVLFDKSFDFLKNNMELHNGLYSWKIDLKSNEKSKANATIDDLRIYRNLIFANQLWGNYDKYIKKMEKAFKKLYKKGVLTDFYDEFGASKDFSLHYFDSISYKILTNKAFRFRKLIYNTNLIIDDSKLSNIPFYYEVFDVYKKKLKSQNEINALHSLLIIYNKQLLGYNIDEEYVFLKTLFNRDKAIFSKYNFEGKPISSIESSAIYGFLKIITKNQNDFSFLDSLNRKIDSLLSLNEDGIPVPFSYENQTIYSFDLLILILASMEDDYEKTI